MFIKHDAMQCNLQSDWSLLNIRIQTQKLFYFEGIKEDGTWLYEKLPTFNTWAIIPTWFFVTYLLKQYTKPPATKARSDPEAISHYDKKVTVKKSSQNFIYIFFFCCLVREII